MLKAAGGPTVNRFISENSADPVTFCGSVVNLNSSRIPWMKKDRVACYEKTWLLDLNSREKLELNVYECYVPILKMARFPI